MFAVKKFYSLLVSVLVIAGAFAVAAANPPDITPLNNKDIVSLVEDGVGTESIIKAIKMSPCTFDTFPSVMKELKRRGVPDDVLQAMIDAPYGPAAGNLSTHELGDEAIYHYTEQIKQFLSPVNSGRRYTPPTRARAARTRIRR
jgi:hypothetical protein